MSASGKDNLDIQVEIACLRSRINDLQNILGQKRGNGGTVLDNDRNQHGSTDQDPPLQASRPHQPSIRTSQEFHDINSLKAAILAKDGELHVLADRLEEKNKCISERDASIAQRDATIIEMLSKLEKSSMGRGTREEFENILQAKDVKIATLQREKALLEAKITEQGAVIIRQLKAHLENTTKLECKETEAAEEMQKKHDEVEALGAKLENIRKLGAERFMRAKEIDTGPFMKAAMIGDLCTIEAFIAMGFRLDARDAHDKTVLHWAAKRGYLPIVEKLLMEGIGIDLQDLSGWTALHYASQNGHLEVVKVLLLAGANTQTQGVYNETALHIASMYGHLEVVERLLNAGANKDLKDFMGRTPKDVVSRENRDCSSETRNALLVLLR